LEGDTPPPSKKKGKKKKNRESFGEELKLN
jgi:hypothetical protein